MHNLKYLFAFAIVFLSLLYGSSCKKTELVEPDKYVVKYDSVGLPIPDPQYPDESTMMGCLVNGQMWRPAGGNWLTGNFDCEVFERTEPDSSSGGELNAKRTLSDGTNQRLHLSLPTDGYKLGDFKLADWHSGVGQFGFDGYFIDYGDNKPEYYCSSRDSANSKLTITHFDFEKNYISGTFQIKMYRSTVSGHLIGTFEEKDPYLDFTDSLVITNGRFGMRYRPN